MLLSLLELCHRTPWKPLLYDEFWFVIHCELWAGSMWFCLRIFKIWFYFDFLLSEAAFSSFFAQVHVFVHSQGREKGRIGELVQLKVSIVEGDTVLFWFFLSNQLSGCLTNQTHGWMDIVQETKMYGRRLIEQPCCPEDFVYFSVLHITFLSSMLTVLCNLKILSENDNGLPHVCNF